VQAADAGNYRVIVSNALSSVTSTPATLTVITPVAITTQPQSLIVVAGSKATFDVSVAGSSPTFQWQKNGTDIPGATSASFGISKAAAGDAGNYTVAVTNAGGSVTSSIAVLTVNIPPAITMQPADVKVGPGGSAVFTVVASGTGPFTYQWKNGNIPITGNPSATTDSLTLTNVQSADSGNYSVVVSNVAGSIKSSAAKLTVK
jgi:hypothetical protein